MQFRLASIRAAMLVALAALPIVGCHHGDSDEDDRHDRRYDDRSDHDHEGPPADDRYRGHGRYVPHDEHDDGEHHASDGR